MRMSKLKVWTKKRWLKVCGVVCGVVMAVVMASVILVVYEAGHKDRPMVAEFELFDASLKHFNSTKYNLNATIMAKNPNKDVFRISFANGIGSAIYANETFAKVQLSPAVAGPGKWSMLTAVFEGSTPQLKSDMSVPDANFRIYDFSLIILLEEIVVQVAHGDEKIVTNGKFEISCAFEVGLSDLNSVSLLNQSSNCIHKEVAP